MSNNKITSLLKYKRSVGVNVGIIVFAFLLIELIVAVLSYANNKHVSPYEVKKGSLYANSLYTGIAIRDENIVSASDNGYIYYYVREGSHVAVGDLVYTIDETGRLTDNNTASLAQNSMTDSDLARLRTEISGFSSDFKETSFSSVYSFKNALNSKAVELANLDILDSIDGINGANSSLVHYRYSDTPGIVTYIIDGYEDLSLENITVDSFDQSNYEYTQLTAGSLVSPGDNIYKICNNEDWTIVIQVDSETAAQLIEMGYVEVRFSRNQYTSWAAVSSTVDQEGNYFIGLTFTNSMITFSQDRFINIELLLDNESGLKIPNSALVTKDFYIVPKEYITVGGAGTEGVLRDSVDDEGNPTVEFIETSIYSENDEEYFLDNIELRTGDLLHKPDSEETYTIRLTDSLEGVYNINKGYAEFREVNVLYQNDDYSIVKPNTVYGLNEYDYIVLDSSTVSDDEMLYK